MLNTINLSLSSMRVSNIRLAFRSLALLLAGIHVFAAISSQSMNADGVSYLDIGDAYFRGDWANAINPVWSPLYSLLLGLANFIFKPSMQWQFPVVHIVNLLIFAGTLAGFEFMWEKVRSSSDSTMEDGHVRLSDWQWWMLGYLLFIWTSLSLIQIWSVTPDMLMAMFVFLAAGLIACIRAGDDDPRLFLRLGLVLALGYLSKTFMFSMALVFLGLAWWVQGRSWKSLNRTVLAAGVFILMSLPFILLISNKIGKFTIGEAGTVTYVRHVIGIPYPHWQGDPLSNIVPTHPSRVIHRSPAVYEFGKPIGGTYPIAMDPSYWYDGIKAEISVRTLLTPLVASSLYYLDLFFQQQGALVACTLALYFMGQRRKTTFLQIVDRWVLVVPAVIAFGLYGLVLVAGRYVGAFILLFWADILANVRLPDMPDKKNWLQVLGAIAATGLVVNIILFNLDGFARLNPVLAAGLSEPASPPARPLVVARELHALGVEQGDKVGVIGYAYDSFWARLANVQIVAEMLEADAVDLWRADQTVQQSVLQSFAKAGVKAVVAESVPDHAQLTNWHRVGNTNYYIYAFTGK